MLGHMTNPSSSHPDDDLIPLQLSVAPEHMAHVERLAARHGQTAQELLENLAARVFGPLGGRIVP